jgi:hypothetical protein
MLEAAWWHPSRDADAGHRWLVGLLGEVARELAADDPLAPSEAELEHMAAIAEAEVLPPGAAP